MQSEQLKLLVRSVAEGDRAAFGTLFAFFAPRIVTYLRRGGVPSATAEELAQEAMILLWRKACSFDSRRGEVSTWVFAIARNLRTDRYRRERAESLTIDIDDCDAIDPEPPPDEKLGVVQRQRDIRSALSQLPTEQLQLLQLSYFADRTHAEIALDLCLPLGTVKSRIRQALISLKRRLAAPPP